MQRRTALLDPGIQLYLLGVQAAKLLDPYVFIFLSLWKMLLSPRRYGENSWNLEGMLGMCETAIYYNKAAIYLVVML